jgi:hypothetical protein
VFSSQQPEKPNELMNRTLTLGLTAALALGGADLMAQTARLQVIHNCADAAAAQVDVWVDNTLLLDNFAFRTASPFVDAPAGTNFTVSVCAPNSTDPSSPVFSQVFNLVQGETYIVVASGIVSGSGYNPAPSFSLEVYGLGREVSAGGASQTDVLVMHGCTDAPTVDVVETSVPAGTVVNDASYKDFAGYLPLPTADYALDVRDATGTVTVASYLAPLQTLGLGGQAITVLASGFLDPTVNSNGPAFGLYAALASGGPLVALPQTGLARLQVIHNCADLAATTVDVWLDNTLLLDDFAFRTASPFIDAPAGTPFTVSICAPNSTDPNSPLFQQTFTLAVGETYVVVASGIVSATGYSPAPAFTLEVFGQGRESATNAANTDVLVYHGSTDAPTVDVYESSVPAGTVVDDASYTDFAGYLELPTADYTIEVRSADNSTIVAAYAAPLAALNLNGAALAVVASGFLDPANNSNGPAFGLWVALPAGGALIPLPSAPIPGARIQVIHNSADLAAAQVDVYLNGGLLLDNFAFRTATPFVDVQATVDLSVAIAPANSTDVTDAIATFSYNLDPNKTYQLVANGIVSPTGYSPATPFDIEVYQGAREAATSGANNTDILVFHGCTDAPTVDIGEIAVLGGATIVDDISYAEFAGYLEVPTDDYVLEVRLSDGTPVVAYQAPLAGLNLNGAALTALASGFLNPANNSNGPAFGLWVALPAGGALVELPLFTAVQENELVSDVAAWPNPVADQLFVSIDSKRVAQAELSLMDMTGRVVRTLPGTSLAAGENRLMVDLSGVAVGMYQLGIYGEGAVSTFPVQVVR